MILTLAELSGLRGQYALVSGKFDPLHAGHLAYLRAAAQYGLPLLCAVAPDAEIAGQRPVLVPEAQRAQILNAMPQVTHVVIGNGAAVARARGVACFIKGREWEGRLGKVPVPVMYVDARTDSSERLLRQYQRNLDAQAVTQFEQFVVAQKDPDRAWTPVTDYSFEARRQIEGKHPELIRDVFRPQRVLDVGCGPGHLMTMLEALGLECRGLDVTGPKGWVASDRVWQYDIAASSDGPDWFRDLERDYLQSDLVICREVLEHLSVRQIRQAVRNLVRLSRKYIYVTTRYATDPNHMLSVDDKDNLDPTHISMLTKPFLRTLFALEGCRSRPDLEEKMDWQGRGRCLVMEVS